MSSSPVSPISRDIDRGPDAGAPGGWVMFAGIVLIMNGVFGVLFGLAAILNDKAVTVGGKGVVIWDFTAWGWITLIVGAIMILTGMGLFTGNAAARWLGVGFATVSALVQFGTISAFPLWSLMVIALDVVVIYQLVARWQQGW